MSKSKRGRLKVLPNFDFYGNRILTTVMSSIGMDANDTLGNSVIKRTYLQLLSYGEDTSPSALNALSEALVNHTYLKRVHLLIPPHFFQDDHDTDDDPTTGS